MITRSFVRRRLWFIDQFAGPSATCNIPFLLELRAPLDVRALSKAVRDVVRRHESVATDQVPAQRLPLPVPVINVKPDDVDAAVAEAAAHRLDISAGVPVRAYLFRSGADEHVLLLNIHHIAADRASVLPLARDLETAYAASV